MSNLKDVAARAGVSIATVSYCVNNTKSVKAETRYKVMKAIEELNYVPNSSARNLKSNTVKEIGVVFPDIDDNYRSELLKGIVSRSEDFGYSVTVAFSYNTPKLESKIIQQFISKNVSGLVILSCQPKNQTFYQKNLIDKGIPHIFIDNFPQGLDVNFLAFDDYKTCHYLTRQLLEQGYRNIVLMTDPNNLFSDYDGSCGAMDAFDEAGLKFPEGNIIYTDNTKESAFRKSMFQLVNQPPQAIIAFSEVITRGIVEAFHLCNIKIPETTCLISLGEECWNNSDYIPGVIHTSRPAYTLGIRSLNVLMENIKSPHLYEKVFYLVQDNIIHNKVTLPSLPTPFVPPTAHKRSLRILAANLPTILSLECISKDFELQNDVEITFEYLNFHDLIQEILADSKRSKSNYDVYLFDVSWLTYLVNSDALLDITDFIETDKNYSKQFLKKNLQNTNYKGRYYGVPIIGGSHILFYRKDLFENPNIKTMFRKKHSISLRPPKTWTEFNGIAEFFTKEYNPESPTDYGTAVGGAISEELALELLIRLWSFGGGLYDQNNHLAIHTPQNMKGMQNFLETTKYIENGSTDVTTDKTFEDFGNGKTAMIISFSEYAAKIRKSIHKDIISQIGYSMLPGQTPANCGWHLGISKTTDKMDLISDYFHWIAQRQTSYYMTILASQSTVHYPYENHELLKLYPWLALTEEGINSSKSRIYPYQGKNRLILPAEVESVLCDAFHEIRAGESDIAGALRHAHNNMLKLFS